MSNEKTVSDKLDVLRMSNEEANKITKECIETALIELLKNEDFEKITISNIVKRAGVSRMAYYRNYSSKEDILSSLINEFWNALERTFTPMPTLSQVDTIIKIFDTLKEYQDIYKVILKASKGDHILKSLNEFIFNVAPDDSLKSKYSAYMASGLLYNIITEWIKNDFEISSEELAKTCIEFRNL